MPTPAQIAAAIAAAKRIADALKVERAAEAAKARADKANADAAAAAKRKANDDAAAAAKRKADVDDAATAKRKNDGETFQSAKRKADDNAAAAAKRKADSDSADAAKRKADDNAAAAAKRKADDETAAAAKARENAAKKAREDAADAKKKRDDDLAAKAKAREDEAAAKRKRDEEDAAKRKADADARKKAREDEAAANKKARDDDLAAKAKAREDATAEAKRKRDEEAEAKRKRDEEAEAKRKRDEEAEAKRKADEEAAAAKKKADEEAAAAKKKADEEAAAAAKIKAEEAAAAAAAEAEVVVNPPVVTPDVVTPDVVTPDVVTPDVVTPDVVTPDVVTPDVVTPDVVTPDVTDPPVVDVPNASIVPQAPADAFADDGRTLAFDTFKNTLALFFGKQEIDNGGWAKGLYKSVSTFYKTGSSVSESLNLSLQDVRNNPELTGFTKRFKGVYALTDRLAAGEAIEVPTIAEYFKSESDIGDILRNTGLGELATQDFLGDVLGRGKSVLEVGNLINQTFNSIDNAPKELKDTLATYFPSVDRTSLAKAMLTGTAGAAELDRKIKGISVLSAAGTQGVQIGMNTANDIAGMGYNYNQSLEGFGQVKQLGRATELGNIGNMNITQEELTSSVFGQNQAAKDKLARIKAAEEARLQGSSGNASNAFSTNYANKSSSAGRF